ncbi:pilus assembly protein TadG-related protein [Aquamicrobium sp.]|uniref:TadE/TadG family type IV pilus assembly protein n=1 Tax=Aquamicrobium sp. TaxID=1872579 RepID=UPI0025873D88|nr:pilus assembly protein TadG-related protein [Aquamicrobium sp.]MCK9550747.1 pilus assembly protein TadG-related protein [Aquamicrobium sp.]
MLRKFLADTRGNYAMITGLLMAPLFGAVALAVDYSEMSRQRLDTRNALDAANIATAREIQSQISDADAIAYANNFYYANLRHVAPTKSTLQVTLPSQVVGGGSMTMCATLTYSPIFFPAAAALVGKESEDYDFLTCSEVRLKNTLEVALVLDNSGSMKEKGQGSPYTRMELLKKAAEELISTMEKQADSVKQVEKPIQFALVPFAASVNIGNENKGKRWMDTDGISSIHHENFNWSTAKFGDSNRRIEKINGVYVKKGSDWEAEENKVVTRFTLFEELKYYTDSKQIKTENYAEWEGCVEQRPYPYDLNDAPANPSVPDTLFVPMFYPDDSANGYNDWITVNDYPSAPERNSKFWDPSDRNMPSSNRSSNNVSKYFDVKLKDGRQYGYVAPYGSRKMGMGNGPNANCTTQPITPLVDVTKPEGMTKIKNAIAAMEPLGGTSVGSGLAWGWRVLSSGEPFTEGRPETDRGNDKVVIVLTDGANTYYRADKVRKLNGSTSAAADNDRVESIYGDYGFLKPLHSLLSYGRLFLGPNKTYSKAAFTNDNYSKAMNEKLQELCANAKAANIMIMTVGLDLEAEAKKEPKVKEQIAGLKTCSSDSRNRRDAADPSKPAKLFWNAAGNDLSNAFREIADELSNLRVTR